MARSKKHWIMFGAGDTPNKSLIGYFDRKFGAWAVKIVSLNDEANYDYGDFAKTNDSQLLSFVDGEYTTLLFANKHGRDSIDAFIKILEDVKRRMEADDGRTD